MYHDDVRQGEGVLTYPGGRQDVGTWQGTKLVQLTFTIKEAHFDPAAASCDHTSKSSKCSLGSPDTKERGNVGPKGQLEVYVRSIQCLLKSYITCTGCVRGVDPGG